jgi:NAD(P)-dependent dehydrogenase (short-subunit alcohol dehydrogenase family)
MMTANSPNLLDLSGRKILITGAAGGIGSATAQLCAQHGARVVLADIVSPDETAERVGDVGRDAEIYSLDMSRRLLVDEMAAKVGPYTG